MSTTIIYKQPSLSEFQMVKRELFMEVFQWLIESTLKIT